MDVVDLPLAQIIPYARNPRRNEKAVATVAARSPSSAGASRSWSTKTWSCWPANPAWRRASSDSRPRRCTSRGALRGPGRAYRITDNRSSENSDLGQRVAGPELGDLLAAEFDPRAILIGFTDEELMP